MPTATSPKKPKGATAKGAFADAVKLKTAGIATAGLLVVVLIGFLIWYMRDTFSGLRGAADAASQGIKDSADVFFAPIGAAASMVRPIDDQNPVRPSEVDARQPSLRLKLLKDSDKAGPWSSSIQLFLGGRAKQNGAHFLVTDDNDQPVAGAVVTGIPVHKLTKKMLGNQTQTTGVDGKASLFWQVANIAGTALEDDLTFIAKKRGYNPSNQIGVG